eukprot:4631009-Pyramimonas_sp.AAC.1
MSLIVSLFLAVILLLSLPAALQQCGLLCLIPHHLRSLPNQETPEQQRAFDLTSTLQVFDCPSSTS